MVVWRVNGICREHDARHILAIVVGSGDKLSAKFYATIRCVDLVHDIVQGRDSPLARNLRLVTAAARPPGE